MVMVAFGTSEPLGSVTVPTIVPSCAKVRSVKLKRNIEHSAGKRQSLQLLGDRNARDLIVFLQNFCSERNLRHRRAVMQKGTVVKPEHARMATRIPRHETLQVSAAKSWPYVLASYTRTRRTGKQQPGHDRASLLHMHAAVNRKNDLVDQFFDLERLPTRPQQIIDTLPISVGDGAVYSEARRRQFDPSAHGFYL